MWTKNQQMVEIRGAHADTNKQITELEAKIAINHDPCPQPGRLGGPCPKRDSIVYVRLNWLT